MGNSANELIKEKERFEALFEYASMGILVANEKGIIEMANNFLINQFGYENKNEVPGKQVEMLIQARYNTTHHNHREKYQQKPSPRSMGIGRDLFAMKTRMIFLINNKVHS